MKKIIFLFFSICYSISALSATLKDVMWEIAVDGNTGNFTFGSGIQITNDIVVTLNHIAVHHESYQLCSEKFRRNETIQKNQSTDKNAYVETEASQESVNLEFESVLVVNNHKNIFVIKRNGEAYISVKVLKIVPYNQDEPVEDDPIRILLLSCNKPEFPESLKYRFFSEKWLNVDKSLSHLKIAFSSIATEKVPWESVNLFWERNEPTLAFSHPKKQEFTISPIHVAGGMSGGGLFENELLVGLLSASTSSLEIGGDSTNLALNEDLFKKYSWDMTRCEEADVTKLKSNQGFSGAFIKELNFEDFRNAILKIK